MVDDFLADGEDVELEVTGVFLSSSLPASQLFPMPVLSPLFWPLAPSLLFLSQSVCVT